MASFSTYLGLPTVAEQYLDDNNAQDSTLGQDIDDDIEDEDGRIITGCRGEKYFLRSWTINSSVEAFEQVQYRGESSVMPDMFEVIKTRLEVRTYENSASNIYVSTFIEWE